MCRRLGVAAQLSAAGTMSFFCFWQSAFAGIVVLLQRHNLNGASLTAWHEMAAFLGLAVLMHVVEAVIR